MSIDVEINEHTWHLALLHDPFGHGFCLLQFQGKGYDEPTLTTQASATWVVE